MFDKRKFEDGTLKIEERTNGNLADGITEIIEMLQKARAEVIDYFPSTIPNAPIPDTTYIEQAAMKMPELMKLATELKIRALYRICIMKGDFDS